MTLQCHAALGLITCVLMACGTVAGRPSDAPPPDASTGSDATEASVTPPHDPPGECENGSLRFGPVSLPTASRGQAYVAYLRDFADPQWSGSSYGADTLPPGLKLQSDALAVQGVPSEAGSFRFDVYAYHGVASNGCSTMPDPHAFRLDVVEPDAGADASSDADRGSD